MRQQKDPVGSGSIRSHAAALVTSVTLRPLTAVIPTTRTGVLVSRRIIASSLAVLGPGLRGSRIVTVNRSIRTAPSVRGEWVRGPGARREDGVILYVHGSGFALCSARTHRGITTRLSALTGLPIFSCDYRLAPSYTFPCAADDVRAAYDWLLAEGHDPGRIVVAGDSAGGHLAIDLSLQLIREGWVPPSALVLFSPVLDLTLALAAARERVRRDPMISAARAARLLDLYIVDQDPGEPRLAFTFAGAESFPPTLVQAGSREMLAADAEQLARSIEECGGSCRLEIWPGQMHVFQALPRIIPEAARALSRAAEFVDAELDAVERRSSMSLVQGA